MIPASLWADWAFRVALSIPVWILARLLSPLAVAMQRDPAKLPGWAWWIGPADHDMCGPNADPMWLRWWETDEGGGRTWYCTALKKAGIRDCAHPIVRWLQLWRNGGAGANYRMLGQRVDDLLITRDEAGGRTLYLAYKMKHTAGIGGGREPMPGARPVAFYLSIYRKSGWNSQLGIKLNHPVKMAGKTYCKLSCSPWRR